MLNSSKCLSVFIVRACYQLCNRTCLVIICGINHGTVTVCLMFAILTPRLKYAFWSQTYRCLSFDQLPLSQLYPAMEFKRVWTYRPFIWKLLSYFPQLSHQVVLYLNAQVSHCPLNLMNNSSLVSHSLGAHSTFVLRSTPSTWNISLTPLPDHFIPRVLFWKFVFLERLSGSLLLNQLNFNRFPWLVLWISAFSLAWLLIWILLYKPDLPRGRSWVFMTFFSQCLGCLAHSRHLNTC